MPAIGEIAVCVTRDEWRAWLAQNHQKTAEIWLVAGLREKGDGISYLDAVEEALCFGWVDGVAKRFDDNRMAQRLTPRRVKSHWTELNKARARRLIRLGLMTAAGQAVLPDLALQAFRVAPDILRALSASPGARTFFESCPALYQRVRVGYVEEQRRKPSEFALRLANLVRQCESQKRFGNWDDSGLRRTGAHSIGALSDDDAR
jgi:uncharacterized protein YdeI (YjbR/CyaY-like superfamily)